MSYAREAVLIDLMAECADQIMAGASVAACLERYPEHAAALAPLLNTVLDIHQGRHVPVRSPAVAAQSRSQFLAAVRTLRSSDEKVADPFALLGPWWRGFRNWGANLLDTSGLPRQIPSGLAAMLVIVILSGILLTGIVSASADALPGNLLYPVKTVTERVQVLFTFDPEMRTTLLAELEERRIEEARAVVGLGRRVINVPLQGTIEAIAGNTWRVSGLTVIVTPDSEIIGAPLVGSRIQGQARAPGDGSLIVRYVEVEPPPAVPTPGPTSTRPVPSATPTATATITRSSVPGPSTVRRSDVGPVPLDGPTDLPTAEPTATPTATTTPTASRTPTATATRTTTPTPAPPREPVMGRIIGYVMRIEGEWWTIDQYTVRTSAETRYTGSPRVGSKVEANVEIKPDGALLAWSIVEIRSPEEPPEPLEFTDVVRAIDGSVWTIGSWHVMVTADTVLENDPSVGDLVEVKAERRADGEVRALRVIAIRGVVVYFDGVIEAMAGDTWQIGGYTVSLTAETLFIGEPAIGLLAQVAAEQMPDGRLIAQIIAVVAPTPTVTPTPSATLTLEPTATQTPSPTPEATETVTPTPEPTATQTPSPTPEATETVTLTPEPTATQTPSPTPEATETSTPTPDPAITASLTTTWTPTPADIAAL